MAVYSYVGVDQHAAPVKGTVAADTPRQAREQLRGQGIRVRRISEHSERKTRTWTRTLSARSVQSSWATAVHELAMLLHAGIPMLEALDTLCEQNSGSFRTALLNVRDKVAAGSSLAEALSDRPDLFDEASVHMVEVGENAGSLDEVLAELADFKQKQMQFRDAVTTAMAYPIFLVAFGTAAAIFLMTSVLPPLLENLTETLEQLPWPTRVAKAISDILVSYGWLLTAIAVGSIIGFMAMIRSPRGRQLWHRFLLRLPVFGNLMIKQQVSRIAMIIATLTKSGVELPRAIELAQRSTANVIFRNALGECGKRISAGEEVAEALRESGAFPPLAVRVFSVGQDSGKLDEMLFRLAQDYDDQVTTSSARLTSLLEPVLILVLAVMVGFLLLATILPILEAGNAL